MEDLTIVFLELAIIIIIASFALIGILGILEIPLKIIKAISSYKYNSADSMLYMTIESLNFNCEETSSNDSQPTNHDSQSFDTAGID
ncbi:hypothetical protein ACL6C3_08975 [Capilliphycus salinus ALCB114379]|uniref:hypothetical protein n=1 Tax=Capilliphycus salinus TaxID=2768948 RepID=UPI0039A5A084